MTRRVEHLSSMYASSHKKQSDSFMCGNYGIGGYYGVHPDYNKFNEPREKARINRISTVMSILDAPEAGGATVFPYAGAAVFPEKGSAAWWFNTHSDSVPDVNTKHSACPVLLGQKWSKFSRDSTLNQYADLFFPFQLEINGFITQHNLLNNRGHVI